LGDIVQGDVFISLYCNLKKYRQQVEMFDLIILDECHNVFSDERKFVCDIECNKLMFTATVSQKQDINDVVFFRSFNYGVENNFL
jgi:type I site-specific restriction endonuclease